MHNMFSFHWRLVHLFVTLKPWCFRLLLCSLPHYTSDFVSSQLFAKLQAVKTEIYEVQELHIKERQELEQTQNELTRDLKLKYGPRQATNQHTSLISHTLLKKKKINVVYFGCSPLTMSTFLE